MDRQARSHCIDFRPTKLYRGRQNGMKITWKLLLALQLIVYPLPSQTVPEQNAVLEWNSRFQCGQQHYQRAELSQAEECYKSALAIAERFPSSDSRVGATLSDLAM